MAEDLFHRAHLSDTAVIQYGHPGANLLHHLHFVGNDNHRDLQFPVQLPQQLQNGLGGGGIQRGGGLITQQHLGGGSQGPGNGYPLLLPAGQLGGKGAGPVSQSHPVQQGLGPGPGFFFGYPRQFQREAYVIQDGLLHKQMEALKDHADIPPGGPKLMLRKGGKFLPAYEHFAGSGFFQQVDAAHQSAFACAGQADDAEDLSLPDGQIDILQGMNGIFAAAECFAYAFQADNGLLFHRFLSLSIKKPLPLFSWRGKGESSRYHLAFISGFAAGSLIKHYHAFTRSRAHPLKTTLSPPRLRDHVQLPCRTPFHQTGALLDAYRRFTLPFVAFAV